MGGLASLARAWVHSWQSHLGWLPLKSIIRLAWPHFASGCSQEPTLLP